jgi:ABC-type sugar transport system ATPase subunit
VASVELREVDKSFGKVEAVRDVSLVIQDREFVVFVGPSGCGKSTLLRMIAGLEEISAGEVMIGGRPMNKMAAADRGIAMVFQSYALYPHMTVRENMGFALKMIGTPKPEVERKVLEAASILQLDDLLDRKPKELSGGQRQRVAIGRAIVRAPSVFLFDEPLSNLDAGLRAQMRVEIARLHKQLETTVIYVTHDQVEAMTLANRIVILNKGRIEQQGSPMELYERPANQFVAGFLGQPRMNFITCSTRRSVAGTELVLPADATVLLTMPGEPVLPPTMPVVLGIRPDAIGVLEEAASDTVPARIVVVEQLGNESLLYARIKDSPELVTIQQPGKSGFKTDDRIHLRIDPGQAHLFDSNGDRIKA